MTTDQEKQFFREHKFKIKGRLFHAHLLVPKENKEKTKTNFNCMFAWKPEENPEVTKALGEFIMKCYQTWYPTVPMQSFTNPIKKYETYISMKGTPAADYLKGHLWVNAATGVQVPPMVYEQGPMGLVQLGAQDESKVYSGRNAVIEISFYRITNQKIGLSTNVNTVLLLDGGEKVASAAAVDPNKVFSEFLQMSGQAPAGNGAQTAGATTANVGASSTQTPPPFPGGFV